MLIHSPYSLRNLCLTLSGISLRHHVLLSPCPSLKMYSVGTSLVAQWLRICLQIQGTRVRSLVQEDPTCRGATKPVL